MIQAIIRSIRVWLLRRAIHKYNRDLAKFKRDVDKYMNS